MEDSPYDLGYKAAKERLKSSKNPFFEINRYDEIEWQRGWDDYGEDKSDRKKASKNTRQPKPGPVHVTALFQSTDD